MDKDTQQLVEIVRAQLNEGLAQLNKIERQGPAGRSSRTTKVLGYLRRAQEALGLVKRWAALDVDEECQDDDEDEDDL